MLQNKLSVGTAFVEANQGQTGDAIIAAAKDVMSGVNQSEASVKMAIGKISDAASGATTVFTGGDLGEIEDGTLLIDNDIYTYNNAGELPDSILVTNGANLVTDGIIKLGGSSSSITVRGDGSKFHVKAGLDDHLSSFGRFTGDNSTLNISDGAIAIYENELKFGNLRVEGERGTAGARSNSELNVLESGTLHVKSNLALGTTHEPEGDETGILTQNTLIQGAGSKITVEDELRGGGSGADVTIDIRSGGILDVKNRIELAYASDYDSANGGKATLELRGNTSKVVTDELQGGYDSGSELNIFADDGATITSNWTALGSRGGSAHIKLTDGAALNVEELSLGRYSGSTATMEIARGATFTSENWLSLGEFHNGKTFEDGNSAQGIENGHTSVKIDILDGGKFYAKDGFVAAGRWEIDPNFEVGDESGTVDVIVSGDGSLLKVNNSADFGQSKNATANLMVKQGGAAVFDESVFFGTNSDQHEHFGGKGTLTVSGEGSHAEFKTTDPWAVVFGSGQSTEGELTVSDSGIVTANGLRAGRDGGKGTVVVDGGSIYVQYQGTENEASAIGVGEHGSDELSTLVVKGGGKITLDGSSQNSPQFDIGRNEGAKGSVEVTGADSIIELINDKPASPDDPDFGNGYIRVGRQGEGSMSILEGGTVKNTANGVLALGDKEGSVASLVVDGTGSTLEFGGAFFIGPFEAQGNSNVSFSNGAVINQLDTFYFSGQEYSGIYLEGGGAKLTIDGSSDINSRLVVTDGNFVVSETLETVEIDGELAHRGGEIDLQIAGTASHDKLVVTQSAELKGGLNIAFEGGYAGAVGDSIELFNATSFDIGDGFSLDFAGLAAGLDAQLQVDGTVASLVIFDSEVADFAIV